MSATVDPAALTISEASRMLRAGEMSSVELLAAVMERLGETDEILHAWVMTMPEEAHAAAVRADRDIAARIGGPLTGIPVGIKDIFDVHGVPTRCGSLVREHAAAAAADAPSVHRMRLAGAVIVGKTTTQEFAAGVVSPPCRNPWDPTRIPGGSSGGSAAAVSVGSAIAALGSDTGGSIRIPSSVCGVVGLKPTFGSVTTDGVFPLAWSLDTVGPIARSVADAALLFDVIADPVDRRSTLSEIGQGLAGIRIGVPRPHFHDRIQEDVAASTENVLRVLREAGATVIETPWNEATAARAAGFVINRAETIGVHSRGLREHPERYGPELRMRMEANALFGAEGYLRAQQARRYLQGTVAALYREYNLDALVAPSLPGVAAPADDPHVTYPDGSREHVSLAYTRLNMPFNLTGQPALNVPAGFDRDGMPIGVQVVGRPHAEARTCRIGHALEQALALDLIPPTAWPRR